jgi:2-phosphoglycerate kinase
MFSDLQRLLSHAYILGGSPCSGKSTIAEMLATQYGVQYYKADDHEANHIQRSTPDLQPVMFKYSRMSWDEIWSQTAEKLLHDEIEYYHERFPFILDDLIQLNLEPPVILEGAAFLPELIKQYPVKHENMIFMIPTMEFQLHHYAQRLWIQSILDECHNPQEAFENWMKRDTLFSQEVSHQASVYGFRVIQVDGSMSIQRQFEVIEAQFTLGNLKQGYPSIK